MTEIKRIYSNDFEIDSDLFKLEVTNMLKNVGYDDNDPILKNVEHCHFFRTFDSNGRKQVKCNFVGGHTHEITVSVNEKGELVAKCGNAIGTKFDDNHKHKMSYIRSDKITKRKLNEEAQKYIANYENIAK